MDEFEIVEISDTPPSLTPVEALAEELLAYHFADLFYRLEQAHWS